MWFLSDRKIVTHMVEDLRELMSYPDPSLGPVRESSSSNPESLNPSSQQQDGSVVGPAPVLTPEEANAEGLWVTALGALVAIISASTRHNPAFNPLLQDFGAAGGENLTKQGLSLMLMYCRCLLYIIFFRGQ